MNSKNSIHQEISERIASENWCYHNLGKLLKFKLLKNIKNLAKTNNY